MQQVVARAVFCWTGLAPQDNGRSSRVRVSKPLQLKPEAVVDRRQVVGQVEQLHPQQRCSGVLSPQGELRPLS